MICKECGAKIEKLDSKTLVIREVPFTKTASSLQESITKAVEKGKLKIRRVEDMTASEVEIHLHLSPGTSSDKTIDALYAFSDCEISISPNCCVIADNKPVFLSVSDVLRHSVDHTQNLLRKELEIHRTELLEQLFFNSLERIFIEERIYKEREFEMAKNIDRVVAFVDSKLEPFKKDFIREVGREDILRLLEIKMQRILKFNKDKADELIQKIKDEIAAIDKDLSEMTRVTIEWFLHLKEKYGSEHPRLTEIKSFDTIIAAKVVDANEKLYIDRQEGFIGTGLKKAEFVQNCSDLDDVIIFYKDGKYKVTKIADKVFIGKGVLHVQVFKKNDKRTIYNVVYRDGRDGPCYIKRFNVTSITRDKEYNITQGVEGSKIMYFTANPNGEAETLKITLDPIPRARNQNIFLDYDFSKLAIKGRNSKGNLLTKRSVHRISLKNHGHSTLGGRKVWFDPDVNRINYEEHGKFLGEFFDTDNILVVLKDGSFYTSSIEPTNHYEDNILYIEKFDHDKVWTAVLLDADNQGYAYLKRFQMENTRRHQNFMGENQESKLLLLTDEQNPMIRITFGGADAVRGTEEVDAEQFVGVKSFKAKGRRLSTWLVAKVEELEPIRKPEPETEDEPRNKINEENLDPDAGKSQQQVIDEITGQLNLFSEKTDEE